LKRTSFIARDISRLLASYWRSWVFWQALIRIWLALMILFAALEIPAFLRSMQVDRERVAEIIEGRKRFSGQSVSRFLDLANRILSATSAAESETLLSLIRTRNPSFPGIVGLASLRASPDASGFVIDQEASRSPDMLISRLAHGKEMTDLLARARTDPKPCMTGLFRAPGPPGEPDKILLGLAYRIPEFTNALSGPNPSKSSMLALVVDMKAWFRENGMPEALQALNFYISNDPPDGIIVSMNRDPNAEDDDSQSYLPVELGPNPGNPLRGWTYIGLAKPRPADADPIPPVPSKNARSREIMFDGFSNHPLRIYVDVPSRFLQSRAQLLVLHNLPLRLALTTLISVLLACMWVLFSAGNQQMRRLAEAQQTITRLNLHRTMIQQELHDHIIQNLTMLGIQVAAASPKDQAGFQATRGAVLKQLDYLRGELRRLLMDGTQRLESFDEMVSQIQSICRHLESQSSARCELKASNPDRCLLNPEVLFRSCRFVEELISNAIRHGAAKRIEIAIRTDAARSVLHIEVSDDGNGFDPENYRPGFGLQSMAAFARRSRGSLRVNRRQPRGMSVELVVPFGSTAPRTPIPESLS
jgi:signal transduction histidine kinase